MVMSLPTVAVWKASWLPSSQTFVQNQLAAMTRWHPLLLGIRRVEGGLPVAPDRAPFGSSLVGRAALRLSSSTGHRWVYDAALRRSEARLIHAHFGTSAVSVLPVARRNRLPLMVTFHGYDVTSESSRTDSKGDRYRQQLLEVFGYADTLIAVSEFIAERLASLGAPEHKVRVHHIGIPVEGAVDVPSRERSGVTFVGRLVEKKGIEDLLAAVARVADLPGVGPVRIVGDGPLMPVAREAAARVGVPVELLGFRNAEEVSEVLASSAVFCAPSKTAPSGDAEAFGMVFLEAALHGLPVVAYRHGGVPEAVQDGVTALLAPEGDINVLAGNLAALFEDPARARALGAAGRARVLADFDVRRCTAELESIYDEVAARGRRGRRGRE